MLSEEQKRKMDEMLAKQAADFKNLAKELKLDINNSDDEADPEIRELQKAMKRQGRSLLY